MKPFVLFAGLGLTFVLLRFSTGQNPPRGSKGSAPPAGTAFRITFGELQEQETEYSGTLSLSEGRVTELIPWRFFGDDRLEGQNSWTLRTVRANCELYAPIWRTSRTIRDRYPHRDQTGISCLRR